MIAIRGPVQRPGLIDASYSATCGVNRDAVNLVNAVDDLRMQSKRGLDGGLSVNLARKLRLEDDVFHDEFPKVSLEHDVLTPVKHVVESPNRR